MSNSPELPEFLDPAKQNHLRQDTDRVPVAMAMRQILEWIYREAERPTPDTIKIRSWCNDLNLLCNVIAHVEDKAKQILLAEQQQLNDQDQN